MMGENDGRMRGLREFEERNKDCPFTGFGHRPFVIDNGYMDKELFILTNIAKKDL
jgi:hypothetical protein